MGIEDYTRRNLGDDNTEGFHMLEHILLRPHAKYPYPFEVHYNAVEIHDEVEKPDNFENNSRIVSENHGLKVGEQVLINGNPAYNGVHTILHTSEDDFEIAVPFSETSSFEETASSSQGNSSQQLTTSFTWQRTPDVRYFIRTSSIDGFAESSDHTICLVPQHNFQPGDSVEITGTINYNGIHEVTAVHNNGFEISKSFVEEESEGRWMSMNAPADPYSLQLTFILPNWIERYTKNQALKQFVENTIREETPAHLHVNIKWLSKNEMQLFDKAFLRFLEDFKQQ